MKALVHLITALLIVPNTASARQIQGSVFTLAKEQNLAHFIARPVTLSASCAVTDSSNFEVVRSSGGYYVERTHTVLRASRIA